MKYNINKTRFSENSIIVFHTGERRLVIIALFKLILHEILGACSNETNDWVTPA